MKPFAKPTFDVTISGFRFLYGVDVEVNSSYDTLTDTAKIILPRKLQWEGKDVLSDSNTLFKRGDKVEIKLGYDHDNKTVFSGFISAIKPSTPMEFECQDGAWLLKQKSITKSYEKVTLKQLLKDIMPSNIPFEAVDVNLGKFKITNVNITGILDELKKAYALNAFFRNGKLYVGLAFYPNNAVKHKFIIGGTQANVIDATDLQYKKEDEVKIKVKAISMLPNNKKIEWDGGDPDGELRTLHFYNKSLAELKEVANREIAKLRYTGYEGSFTTFGEPTVKHGDYVELVEIKNNRVGTYLVKAVQKRSGTSGYRQIITLDKKIA